MNNLDKLKILTELVELRREKMHINEAVDNLYPFDPTHPILGQERDTHGNLSVQGQNQYATESGIQCPDCLAKVVQGQNGPVCPQCGKPPQRQVGGQQQSPFSNKAGTQNFASNFKNQNTRDGLREEAACSSEGAGSRTGMTGEFAQDAATSSERKRSMEGYKKLEEGLESYYKIAGLYEAKGKKNPARPAGEMTGCKGCGGKVHASNHKTDYCLKCYKKRNK